MYFDLYDEDTEGARPDRLVGVRPQERNQRHTVEQIVDTVLIVPSLDVPVPQMENQLVDVCRLFDVLIPEQAIEVPTISPTPRPLRRRRVLFAEQTAEQVVEVPTIIFFSFSRYSGLWSRTSTFQFLVVEGSTSVFKVFLPRQRSTERLLFSQERSSERIVEQIVDSRVLGGGSSASSSSSREHAGEGVFSTFFPGEKSAKVGPHSSPRVPASVSPSTSSAQLEGFFIDENDDVWMRLPSGQWMLLGSDQHVFRDEPG